MTQRKDIPPAPYIRKDHQLQGNPSGANILVHGRLQVQEGSTQHPRMEESVNVTLTLGILVYQFLDEAPILEVTTHDMHEMCADSTLVLLVTPRHRLLEIF
jgi:hypothetical protein